MPVFKNIEIHARPLHDNATYRTLVGNDDGSTPLIIGLQISPPGFNTGVHWHPYMEIVIVLEGCGKAWIEGEGEVNIIEPGMTMIFPPNVKHWFSVTGKKSMKTYGIHASPNRVVKRP